MNHSEDNKAFSAPSGTDLKTKIQMATEWVEERMNQATISDESKASIRDNFQWLVSMCRDMVAPVAEEHFGNLMKLMESSIDLPKIKKQIVDSAGPPKKREHLTATDWMENPSFTKPTPEQKAIAAGQAGTDETQLVGAPSRTLDRRRDRSPHHRHRHRHHHYAQNNLIPIPPVCDNTADVDLRIPNVSVGLIDFELNNLSARVAVDAGVANDMVRLFAGVDVRLERVKLTIEDVQVSAQLVVRLDNVRKILERGLEAVDSASHPSILGMAQHLLK